MKNLIRRKVKGFKFENEELSYLERMDEYIGKVGEIKEVSIKDVCISFGDDFFYYPLSEIENHLVDDEPTLEQVKEFFMYAKEVRCISDEKIYEIDLESIRKSKLRKDYLDVFCYDVKGVIVNIYDGKVKKYAEIISYKEAEITTPAHYNNEKGTLYKVASERGWNSYLFDIVKRLERAEKKGEFETDLKKSIAVIQLWLKEKNND
jgi:hypothetical protein